MRAKIAVLVCLLLSFVATKTRASEGFDDLVRLLKAQNETAISYVRGSRVAYNFTPEEISYLYDMGVPSKIIVEAIQQGKRRPALEENPPDELVVLAPPPDETNMSLFFDALEPYGQWIEVQDTWVWRPQVAISNSNWRPYCDAGSWVYTDVGWAWHSNYSWGWAPFHYGRWKNNREFGWVWTPDAVWGPAWVSWRTGDQHYG